MGELPVSESVTTLSELLCASPQRVTVAGTARLQYEAARLCDELQVELNKNELLRARVAELEEKVAQADWLREIIDGIVDEADALRAVNDIRDRLAAAQQPAGGA